MLNTRKILNARNIGKAACFSCVVTLSGCAMIGPKPPDLSPIVPIISNASEEIQVTAGQNGTIYRINEGFSFFEERKANKVGSTILVVINESMSASKSASTKAGRQASVNSSITALPGVVVGNLPGLGFGGTSKNDFTGSGQSAANNVFNGTITTTIARILPNGNFVLKGNKEIGLNQEVESIKFSGIVSPANIKSDGSVSSQNVSDVRLETRSSGAINESQVTGWLSRLFMSYSPI